MWKERNWAKGCHDRNWNWASFGCGNGWSSFWWGNGLDRCIGKDGFKKSDIAASKIFLFDKSNNLYVFCPTG